MCWVSWTRSLHFSWPTTLARSNSGQTLCLGWTWWIEAHTEILFPRYDTMYDISKAGKHGWNNMSFPSPVSLTCHVMPHFFELAPLALVLRWANRINGHWMNRSAWSKKRRRPPRTDGTGWEPIGLQELVWKTRVVFEGPPECHSYGMLCKKTMIIGNKWNYSSVKFYIYFCGNSKWMNMTVCTCRYL